jgi:hypothetical protein
MALIPLTHRATYGGHWQCRFTLCVLLLAPLLVPAQSPSRLPPFERLDVNGDGSIDVEEARRRGLTENLLRQADANHDGRASREEYRQWRERRADSRQRDATPEQAPAEPPPRLVTGQDLPQPPLATNSFNELDRNGDGVIGAGDARDLPAIPRNRLDDMDRDGDGLVQRSEFEQYQHRRAHDRTLDTPRLAEPGL